MKIRKTTRGILIITPRSFYMLRRWGKTIELAKENNGTFCWAVQIFPFRKTTAEDLRQMADSTFGGGA